MKSLSQLPPGSRCAQPGYGFTVVCGQVARIRRLRRHPGSMKNLSQLHPRLALRLAGLWVYRRLRTSSPDKTFTSPSGSHEKLKPAAPRLALRLAGLRVYRRLRTSSPDKTFTSPSGNNEKLKPAASFLHLCCCSAPARPPASGPGTARPPASGNHQPAPRAPQSRRR